MLTRIYLQRLPDTYTEGMSFVHARSKLTKVGQFNTATNMTVTFDGVKKTINKILKFARFFCDVGGNDFHHILAQCRALSIQDFYALKVTQVVKRNGLLVSMSGFGLFFEDESEAVRFKLANVQLVSGSGEF